MFRTLKSGLLKNTVVMNKRNLWKWIDDTFNRQVFLPRLRRNQDNIDDERIMEIGPNLACAEWLMKNGAQVKWKGCNEFVGHYNCLPSTNGVSNKQLKIEQVYAGQEASISHLGFNYFKDCKDISDVAFVGCNTINDEALNKLQILKDNLKNLKINGCVNVSDKGILELEHLQALKHLELKNLLLQDESKIINHLTEKLPECKIEYTE